jgi:hypothetical protein
MTFTNYLSKRTKLLISHKCLVTLQNLADYNNNELLNENSVKELKNTPHSPDNQTLKEMMK